MTLAGVVGKIGKDATMGVEVQTRQILDKIDAMLKAAGSSKSRAIEARIWLADITRDFGPMNKVWGAWIDPKNKPVRACVEAKLCFPELLVEIQIVAAVDPLAKAKL